MSEINTGSRQCHAEIRSMVLEDQRPGKAPHLIHTAELVRGPGVCGRAANQDAGPKKIAITPKTADAVT